ncbi:Zn finger protein HypA/HybF (possibly regulating hydrogenase expression) [Cryptobacterium curtum DSM 15641]|uniref:Hydrogenase maturation factor HypA n=1 Tax=Cryptobacterium curtum (strain ATCC 700683 / DSM 15641 / CCUG 43107 / 12-3) TaxID=469378 RepID=C7MPM0_CRYCD|nr:hydrogenase maturation nickel metallochaperone HypA [Cryptobacterium curtum]ACU94860.1 Zn finger protein HypA/HybF (possibly regulating hydrogenase expression) [Cryptobacterium curtum DSM 15641]
MHELGMMTSVMDAVTRAAHDAGADKVLQVTLSVGEMTEAIEDCLVFAYEALTEDNELFKGSKLTINMVSPRSRCLECGHEFDHDRFHMTCPNCDSFATELIAGRDLAIESIEVDIPDGKEE